MLRTTVKRAFARAGWNLTRRHPWSALTAHLEPATVVDVGAAYGTPDLYKAFPDAYHVLIDPLAEYEPHLRRVLGRYRGEHHTVAVGSEAAELTLQVDPGEPRRSSFHYRTRASSDNIPLDTRKVPVCRLDDLAERHEWTGPFVLKLDTEGHELAAIRGASRLLADTVGVIAEVSVAPRFEGGYRLDEIVAEMAERGFAVANVIEVPGPRGGRVMWLNLLFEPVEVRSRPSTDGRVAASAV